MKKYKVLLVDDIYVNRVLLSEIIREIGCEYKEASNGQQAIDTLKATDDIDIVFMDIEMPTMNGFETTKYIREKLPARLNKIPIVAITAHDPTTFFEEYSDIGFNELITKPYSVEKISRVINKLCD